MKMTNNLQKIKSNTMKKSWKLGLIKPRQIGIEKISLIPGNKYNHLTIVKFHHFLIRKNKRNYFYYLCKCDCGKEKIIIKDSILNGDTKSCGCYHRKQNGIAHRLKKGIASLHRLYDLYKIRAKSKHIVFNLTLNEFKIITSSNCYYCGTKPNQFFKNHTGHYYGTYKYNGLDRLDSNKGYIKNNIVPCCKYCNFAKNDLSINKFYNHIKKIYEYIKKR
jgi:hypothetical protein